MVPGVTYHRRESWQDPRQPVTGPPIEMGEVDTYPLHYTADDDLIDGDPGESADDLAQYLRDMQRYYVEQRGHSTGYNFAVDWLGGVWELRGFDHRCAANRGWNYRAIAVLCLVDGQDPMTVEAVESVNKILAEANRRTGRTLNVVPHSEIGATRCCGDGIRAQISAGMIKPWKEPAMRVVAPQLLVDTRHAKTGVLKPHDPQRFPLPEEFADATAVSVYVENITKDTHADGGHLRLAGTRAAINDSPGYAHTEPDGVNSNHANVLTPDGVVWIMAVLNDGDTTHVKATVVGVEQT